MAKDRGTPKPTTGKSSALSKVSLPQWIALGLTVLAVVFIVQNRTTVRIDLFWVSVEGMLAIALMLGGGLTALQAMAVSTGLPFTLVLLGACYAIIKGLMGERREVKAAD